MITLPGLLLAQRGPLETGCLAEVKLWNLLPSGAEVADVVKTRRIKDALSLCVDYPGPALSFLFFRTLVEVCRLGWTCSMEHWDGLFGHPWKSSRFSHVGQ